jgi:hypothetical protein
MGFSCTVQQLKLKQRGWISPKSFVDRHLGEGLEDARKGRTHGPYNSANEAIAALDARAKRHAKERRA